MANISQVRLPDNSIYSIVPVINPNNTVIDASVHVGPYPLNANSLCMVATDGILYPFVQTLGTNTDTTYPIIPDTIKFRIGTDIFAAGKAYNGSAGAIDVSTLAISEEVDIRYSSRRLTGASGTSYSAIPAGQHNEIYMYISIQPEDGTFNPTCDYIDGYGYGSINYIVNILAKEKVKANTFCMFLGYSSNYSAYQLVWLSPEHPIYYCDSRRNFIPYDTWRNNVQDTSISLIDTSIANIESAISSNTLAYRNPVAGYNTTTNDLVSRERMFTANNIIKAQLVFEGADNFIYSITQSDVSVNPDWGLAYWNGGGSVGVSTLNVNEVIQQESLLIADTCIGLSSNVEVTPYFPVYAWFKYTNNTIKSTVDSSVLHSSVPLADSSNDTYVYVGTVECVDGQPKYLHMDLSNHDFITLGHRFTDGKNRYYIVAINGKLLDGGSTSGGNYNNPVSGADVNPPAAYALQQYDFVCYDINQNGLVPLRCYYNGTLSTSGIAYDWGLAFCNADVAAGGNPPEGSILQQITLDTANTAGKPMHMYMFFDSDGIPIPNQNGTESFPIFSGQSLSLSKTSELTPYVPSGKGLTQIYIGVWVGNKFHIDLSNHDFITYGTQIAEGSTPGVYGPLHTSGPYISYINGRPFLGASGGGDSGAKVAYGICDDYDMGGVTPMKGSGDGTDRGQISGSGPFTLIATTNDRNYTPGESLVSLYLTGIDMYAGAYLQIDNNTAYPIYYEDHAVTRYELKSESVATFIFNSSTYYLVAGAAGGDYELTANKVQRVDSSSTYNQYPSARCIYNMIGDIEAALQAI